MSDLSQSIRSTAAQERVLAHFGRARVPIAECPRCGNDVDLKGHRLDDGESELVFKAHYDNVTMARCPTAGLTPARAAAWIAETRALLGIGEAVS